MSEESKTESTAQHAEAGCLCGGVGPSISRLVRAMAPPEGAAEHFRQAKIEMLKGLRELLDHRIAALSAEPEGKGTKVTVE